MWVLQLPCVTVGQLIIPVNVKPTKVCTIFIKYRNIYLKRLYRTYPPTFHPFSKLWYSILYSLLKFQLYQSKQKTMQSFRHQNRQTGRSGQTTNDLMEIDLGSHCCCVQVICSQCRSQATDYGNHTHVNTGIYFLQHPCNIQICPMIPM